MKKTVNFSCWSLGAHARLNILPAIKKISETNLVGAYTRNHRVLNEVASQYGCVSYESDQDLVEDLSVNAVYISSPTSEHYHQAKKALSSKKHVLIEKSAFASIDQALEMVDLANSKQCYIFEAFMFRYHDQILALKNHILEHAEDIISVVVRFGFPHFSDIENIRYKKDLAGGALNDAGAYCLAFFNELIGGKPRLVTGSLRIEPGFEVDTSGHALIEAERGETAYMEWGFGRPYQNSAEIWTTGGMYLVERAFSKPGDLSVSISKVINEKKYFIYEGSDNHFEKMLLHVSDLINQPFNPRINDAVVRQARLVEQIRKESLKR